MERDTETNYDYFGARYYDSELSRWLQVDPLADKYPGWSPYNYTLNNPLRYIDPKGMDAVDVCPDDDPEKEKSNTYKKKEKNEKGPILHIGLSASVAYYALGWNFEIGLVSNLSNGESEFIFRTGQSFGYGTNIGVEATISPDQSLIEYEGKNSFGKEAGENVVEIEFGGKFAGNIMLDPQNKLLPNGFGGSFGVGKGWFVNLTNVTYSSGSFNMGDAIRKISENPKSAFWKK